MQMKPDQKMFLLLILIPIIPYIHGQVGCPKGSKFFNGYCYYLETDNTKEWSVAQTFCEERYEGELTSITSQEENDFIYDLIQHHNFNVWFGLHKNTSNDEWYWTDGSNFNMYQNWGPGEPNSYYDCAEIVNNEDRDSRNQWNDVHCNTDNSFICKFTIFKKFYQIPMHSDYEIRFNFSANQQPITIEWYYGKDFLDMPDLIQIPSDNGKFSTSLIDLENGKYQAILRIAEITKKDYNTKFKLHIANETDEIDYRVMLYGCGGEYNSDSGIIRHPSSGDSYQDLDYCTWIIRTAVDKINITFVSFDTEEGCDFLYVRDGEDFDSEMLDEFTGGYNVTKPLLTKTNATHVRFISDSSFTGAGFELLWEPAVKTFSNIPMHSDYEVRFNLSANPQPTTMEWSYGPNFQEMPNIIQVPSDNEKFSTSLIELENGNYQALFRIAGLTEEDTKSKFKLHVANELGETDYKFMVSGCGGEYNSSSGMISYPLSDDNCLNYENCVWIIRVPIGAINITIVSFNVEKHYDTLEIREVWLGRVTGWLGKFTGSYDDPFSVQTSTNEAHLHFTSDAGVHFHWPPYDIRTGFEIHWKLKDAPIQTHHVSIHSDFEVKLNFSANPEPTALKWSYGASFRDMPHLIQVPSDNGKFSTSLINLENGKYQALLKIAGITGDDIETKFMLHVANSIAETNYRVMLYGCGGEYNSSSGMIRHPWTGDSYKHFDKCTWIIRAADRIAFTFVNFDTELGCDALVIRDGDSMQSKVLHWFSGEGVPRSFQTSTSAAHLHFKQSCYSRNRTGFELHWEPVVETFYQILLNQDHEVQINFTANPQPTSLKWFYGANFQEMPNLIPIPSDNGKFSTSLIDLGNDTYQASLIITKITEEDIATKFKLHVENDNGETYYRAALSRLPHSPLSVQISDIMTTSVKIAWKFNVNQSDTFYYVIQYKLYSTEWDDPDINHFTPNGFLVFNSDQDYTEISSIVTNSYTVTDLTGSTAYEFRVLAGNTFGCGPPSEPLHVTTRCGGEYNSSSGMIRHPLKGGYFHNFQNNENCTWIIRAPISTMKISLVIFNARLVNTELENDYLYIRDGDSIESNVLQKISGNCVNRSVQTNTNTVHLLFTSNSYNYDSGFELHWEPGVAPIKTYQISMNSDYEVRLNFSAKPQPTTIEWFYGVDFQKMPNLIQIPSSNGKFSTALIDLENGNYQALLRISGITEEDIETKFNLHVANEIGEANYRVILSVDEKTIGCGGEYNTDSGMIRHPLSGCNYQVNENCTWIIRALDRITIYFVSFNTPESYDDGARLYIYDGENIEESRLLVRMWGRYSHIQNVVTTTTNAAHLLFTSDSTGTDTGFDLHWEPAVKVFYHIPLHSDYEVKFNISTNQQPTSIEWSYGPNFENMPNLIQIPSDNGKYATFLTDLENGKYQARLKIAEITGEDFKTFFKLRVTNEIGQTDYKVKLSGCGGEYNSSNGTIRHPLHDGDYNMNCTWIIRAAVGTIKIRIVTFHTDDFNDYLFVRDGESIESDVLQKLSGKPDMPSYVQTSKNAMHILFIADTDKTNYEFKRGYNAGFEIHWEHADAPISYHSMPLFTDYEVKVNFSANPKPTVFQWYYGANFQEMPNLIQIPSDNGKFSTSLFDLQNGNYQAFLRISRIREKDIETKFKLHVANEFGEADYKVILYGCGGEYNSNSGIIRHPWDSSRYRHNEKCTWIIRAAGCINITFVRFNSQRGGVDWNSDFLYIRDGDNIKSNVLRRFRGDYLPRNSVLTSSNVAHLLFISDRYFARSGFELYWELADAPIQTFYQIPIHSDYEVRLNFSANPQPTALRWSYGPNFHEMSNQIQIPSDNGKFSTSLIDLEDGKYQALLKISGIREEDFENKFKLHDVNETGRDIYKVKLSREEKPFECPEGFFMTRGTTQCFKIFLDKVFYWEEAMAKCKEEGLIAPKLADEVAAPLRKYLLYTYGEHNNVWLAARADGSKWWWQNDRTELRRDNPLFYSSFEDDAGDCLSLMVDDQSLRKHPEEPYGAWSCRSKYTQSYALCQIATPILFNFNEMVVNPKDKIQLDCGTTDNYSYCVWEKDNKIFKVKDVYKGVYSGMGNPESTEGNQCGIVVDQATIEDHGIWTCKMYMEGTALVRSRKVILAVSPTPAQVSPQQVIGEPWKNQEVTCSVMAARPAAQITWTYNGTDISSRAKVTVTPSNPNGTYMTISTLSYYLNPIKDGQMLQCVVSHYSLPEPEVINVPITVHFEPRKRRFEEPFGKFYSQSFSDICVNSDYEIRVNFSAKPRPTALRWSYGTNFQEMPNIIQVPSDDEKFSTSLIELGNNNYQALLRITGITEEEIETEFELHVENEVGEEKFEVEPSKKKKEIAPLCSRKVPGCSELFTPVGNSCLLLALAEQLTWAEAREYCQALGADLVVIKDANHYADMLGYIWRLNGDNATVDLWIGGSDETMEGHWVWITGELMPQGPPFWGSLDNFVAEPSGGTINNCAGLHHQDRYYMHDFICTLKHAPICQKIPT